MIIVLQIGTMVALSGWLIVIVVVVVTNVNTIFFIDCTPYMRTICMSFQKLSQVDLDNMIHRYGCCSRWRHACDVNEHQFRNFVKFVTHVQWRKWNIGSCFSILIIYWLLIISILEDEGTIAYPLRSVPESVPQIWVHTYLFGLLALWKYV
jgi:hypothetical protein